MKKKVLVYYYTYPLTLSSTHSVPRLLTQLINELSRDFDITILEYSSLKYELSPEIKRINISINNLKEKVRKILGFKETQKNIRQKYTRLFFNKNKIPVDIVIVLSYLDFEDVIKMFPKVVKVYWVHDFSIDIVQRHLSTLNLIDYLISPSYALSKKMKDEALPYKIKTKTLIIPNWVSDNLIQLNSIKRINARNKFEIPLTSIVFIFIGGDSTLKGSHLIENILREVSTENRPIVLIKAGTNNITRKQNNHLLILEVGKLPPEELAFAYAASNFGIFPSQVFENLPLAIIEMITFGILPIASDIGGVSELLGNNYQFLIKDLSNTRAWVEKINTLINTPDNIKEMQVNELRKLIAKKYNFKNSIDCWRSVLKELTT